MATPFVSGVVALMLAKHRKSGGNTPVETVGQLREHLHKTARDVGAPGHDDQTGWGLIDPASMLARGDEPEESQQEPSFEYGGVKVFMPARAGDAISLDFGE